MRAGNNGDEIGALEIVAADLLGFSKVLEKVLKTELESFQGLSGQYGLYEDVDGVQARLQRLTARLLAALERMRDEGLDAAALPMVSGDVELLDNLLEQLDRYVAVADLRGATLTSGDLLKKLQGWVKTLRDWLVGVRRQLTSIAASA